MSRFDLETPMTAEGTKRKRGAGRGSMCAVSTDASGPPLRLSTNSFTHHTSPTRSIGGNRVPWPENFDNLIHYQFSGTHGLKQDGMNVADTVT